MKIGEINKNSTYCKNFTGDFVKTRGFLLLGVDLYLLILFSRRLASSSLVAPEIYEK